MSNVYLVLIVLVLIAVLDGLNSGLYEGVELPLVFGAAVVIGFLVWRFKRAVSEKKKPRADKSPEPELVQKPKRKWFAGLGPRSPKQRNRQQKAKPERHVRSPKKFDYIDSVADSLREIARDYEDSKREVFLVLKGLHMRRMTGSQDFEANAVVQIARSGFRIDFVTLNSRTGKPRSIEKKWSETIGATPNRFEIYLKDHSLIELVPLDKEMHLRLSAFWQVFNPGLNGFPEQFQSPVKSGLGHRLREVANYMVENKPEIGVNGALDVGRVPSKVSEEEFHGIYDPKIPKKGEKLGRWKLVEELGSGAFGNVFRVENVDDGSVCALKLMSPNYGDKKLKVDSQIFRMLSEGFLDEAKLSSKVNNPFVLSAIDSGQEPWPWILYPFVEGNSPRQEMAASEDPRGLWWNFAHDLLSALNAIHTEGLLHRDVKPDNIRGTKDRFVLLDLGIGQVKGYSDLVGGAVGGTVGYMAPEILLDPKGDHGYATDIFSAGMTLLAMFNERAPFELSQVEKRSRETGDNQALINFLSSSLDLSIAPQETRALLSVMLDPNPNQRPPARKLLAYVSDFVDLEAKIQMIQAHNAEMYEAVDVEDQSEEERTQGVTSGPFKTWQRLETEIYHILEDVRPRYFIATLKVEGFEDMIYLQAINDLNGQWHLEAISETFADESQSTDLKKRMLGLGWTPPSGSDPNWGMDFTNPPYPEIVRVFTDAFEFGFQIRPNKVISIELIKQGEGLY